MRRWVDNITIALREVWYQFVDCLQLTQSLVADFCENGNELSGSVKIATLLTNCQLLVEDSAGCFAPLYQFGQWFS
jgi:hypothetical protein